MFKQWIPINERSQLTTLISSGNQLGAVITLILGGLLAEQISWQSIFYVFGCFGIFVATLWAIFGHNSPQDHPTISSVNFIPYHFTTCIGLRTYLFG
ncbi:MAG TPA: MFS transporter [Bacteroidetes bacterium]|nr:MFS transporter [Bacteroidota bacterium]